MILPRVYLRTGRMYPGLSIWWGNGVGMKIMRKRDFLFSDRYVHVSWPVGFGWRVVWCSRA